MDSFSASAFQQGFLEEAGEHLQNINQNLLRLEQLQGQPGDLADVERIERLNELFRSFHTIKGLAGMVGLKDASALSHSMETVLQAVRKGSLDFHQAVVDQLFASTRTLTALVDSLRDPSSPAPDITADQRQLAHLLEVTAEPAVPAAPSAPAMPATAGTDGTADAAATDTAIEALLPGLVMYPDLLNALGDLERSKIQAAARAGHSFALVVFASTAERAQRGENVDRVRHDLEELGLIIKAAPTITDGKMRFLFLFAGMRPLEPGAVIADEIIPLTVNLPPAPTPAVAWQMESAPGRVGRSSVVRVDLERLDDLMRFTGDLIVQRARLGENLARLDGNSPLKRELMQTYQQIGRTLRDLRRAILRARMVPLAETFNHIPLVVRDLARATQKEVRLEIQGENAQVDKLLVEKLLDPLIHLVRNAVIHGIEPPAERAALGKPEQGVLRLRGTPQGDDVLIEVSDDGRGVDLERVAAKAAELGWLAPDQPVDADEALALMTRPGFSTLTQANLGAGRGVGLDVVQRMVRAFGGQLSLETTRGQGTTFRLRMPLTMVIVEALFVRAGDEHYAISRDAVERVVEIDPAQVVRVEGGELFHAAGEVFYLRRLDRLVGAAGSSIPPRPCGLIAVPGGERRSPDESRQMLVVDQVKDMREIVVRPVVDPLVAQPGIQGAAELGDGSVVLILDLPALLKLGQRG